MKHLASIARHQISQPVAISTTRCLIWLRDFLTCLPSAQAGIKAWQKADYLAVDVYDTTKSFPRHQLYSLTNQMQRAAVSVLTLQKVQENVQ